MSNNLKYLKIILSLIIIILLFITFDYLYLSITKKPLIIIDNSQSSKLSGLIYDIYTCEDDTVITTKGSKFSCPISKEKSNQSSENSSSSSKKESSSDNPINKKTSSNDNQSKKITVIDKSDPNASCAEAIEYYYEDNEYKYYFTCIKSPNIYIKIDNEEYNIKYALNNHIVTIEELESSGFKPLKESKNLVTK